ncbi:MAG TPA: hypothetical protein VF544_19350 [Pyrinomonadaceae bacterium]|jgi:hypothetical protein
MMEQNRIIEPGDGVRVCSGGSAGQTGTAIDVVWYSEQSHLHALVHVMSDEGVNHFFDMRMLEKMTAPLDKDPPSDGAQRTWKHVK